MKKLFLIILSLVICSTLLAQFDKSRYTVVVSNDEIRLRRSVENQVIYNVVTGASFRVSADSLAGFPNDTTAVIQTASGQYARLQYPGQFKQSWFGLSENRSDSIANRIAMQKMLDYVALTKMPNVFCDQTDTIHMRIENSTPLTFPYPGRSIHFYGTDTLTTIYKAYPLYTGTADWSWFTFNLPNLTDQGGTTSFTDCQFIMPDSFSIAPLPNHVSWFKVDWGGIELRTDRVQVMGNGKMTLHFGGANFDDITHKTMNLKNSFFHAWESDNGDAGVLQYTGGRHDNFLYVDNCIFSGSGGTGHQLYVQPWLNWDIRNTVIGHRYFGGSSQVFQSNQTTLGTWNRDRVISYVPTLFQRMENVVFMSSPDGIYEAFNLDINFFPHVELTNVKFYNGGRAVLGKNYMKIIGCTFESGGPTFSVDGGNGFIQIADSYFRNAGTIIYGGGAKKDIKVNITDCYFDLTTTSNVLDIALNSADSHTVDMKVSNCTFINNTSSIAWPLYWGNNGGGSIGDITLENCKFEGLMSLFRDCGPNSWMFRNCVWKPNGNNFYRRIAGGTSDVGDTRFYEIHNMRLDRTTEASEMTFYGFANDDFDSINCKQRLQFFLPPGKVYRKFNPIVQSDGTIDTLCIWYDTYYLNTNGQDTLKRISFYEPVASFIQSIGNQNYWGKIVAGELNLIFSDTIALANNPEVGPVSQSGNNIDTLRGTSSYMTVPNERVTFWFNRLTDLWECISCEKGFFSMGEGWFDSMLQYDWRMAYMVGYDPEIARDGFSRNAPFTQYRGPTKKESPPDPLAALGDGSYVDL